MQRSMESDFEDENEICYTSKRRAQPILAHYDDDSFPSSSWTNPHEVDDDQRSSSMDYYQNDDEEVEDDELFNLPPSSNDLLVPARQALHLATIYEFLRHFSSILRLSPFLFEHFCTSIIKSVDINNLLFSQIHICLLRLLIKQDDDDGITYASETDVKGIVDLSFVTMDYLTWPHILQLYVSNHPQLKMLSQVIREYPFNTSVDDKVDVLSALCDVVLTTKIIRREFDDTKPKQHDDNCRQCQKRGDLLCCDRCEATYHLTCLNPPLTSVPTVEWFCPVCVQNQVHGVTDCIPPREHRPFYLRHRCIGHDREQRRYWFVCRRLFVEDEIGDDVRYYSTLEQFDTLLSCLDEAGPEKLLVYRLQKRYDDIARCMHITGDLPEMDESLLATPSALDFVPRLDDDEEEEQKSLSTFTDGLVPCYFDEASPTPIDYDGLLDRIKLKIQSRGDLCTMLGQIDGIYDDDEDNNNDESHTKSFVRKREFFTHSNNGYPSPLNGQTCYPASISIDVSPANRMNASKRALWEERVRHQHNIYDEARIAVARLNDEDVHPSIWQRYEQYRTMNRGHSSFRPALNRPYANNPSYPRSNYYRDYYTGNNYEDEDGILLNNEYDDFGDDFFQQEENGDEFDIPFRKYDSSRVYRGTTRGRPRGRGRPPLYGRGGRASHTVQPPRGVNHLTTGSFQSSQHFIQPKLDTVKSAEQPARNKRKPAKVKSTPVTPAEEKPRRPGKILRSGRISRKPRRDSETDFGSDNSDDSGAKDKETGSDDDEEFNLTQLGFGNPLAVSVKRREGSSSSNDSLAVKGLPLSNFAAFAQSQLLAANLANGIIATDELSNDSDFSADDFESDEGDDLLPDQSKLNSETLNDDDLDDFTYSQTMLSLINSMQPQHVRIDLDLVPTGKTNNNNNNNVDQSSSDGYLRYENFYQTNPLATRKQMLLSERDRRAHLARKFSFNQSPLFSWYTPRASIGSNYSLKEITDVLRLTLVHFENTVPLPFMHSHWKRYRYIWAKQLLDLDTDFSLGTFINLFLQFEACVKPVAYFDLFTDQVGYLKFRRETEKERDEAKKEEKDALIRRKIDSDSIVQTVHFTRPLKHSVHRQRGEEYRLAGGQGWTFIRSTRRQVPKTRSTRPFDVNSLLTRRENMSNAIVNERLRIMNLLEAKVKVDLPAEKNLEEAMSEIVASAKDDNDDLIDDLSFINYKLVDFNGVHFRYPVMLEDTRPPFHLAGSTLAADRKALLNPFQLPSPWTFTFDDQTPNIFILPAYILRRLARASMIVTDAPGFLNARLSGIGTRFGWPYPCGRPSVRTAWCYKVSTSSSFFAVAHHLKYLWHCIRWDLLTEKLSNIDESSITTQVDQDGMTTTIQVLAKRDSGPFDSYCEYFVRKTISSLINDHSSFNNIPISKSRSRAVPHPSSILNNTRLILSEQWLPERQLQPNQIKYYYQCLQEKSFKRLHKKSNDERRKTRKKSPSSTAKPFIVRIPHLQPKSALTTETGKVVLVQTPATGDSSGNPPALPQQANKSFSVVKLADGQIILVPTTVQQSSSIENGISKVIKATSPPMVKAPVQQHETESLSAQERRLRPIAPAPVVSFQTSTELLNSLLAQQQRQLLLQQQAEGLLNANENLPVKVSGTVVVDGKGSSLKPKVESQPSTTPKMKNARKAVPIPPPTTDEKSLGTSIESRKPVQLSASKKGRASESKSSEPKASAKRPMPPAKADPEEGFRKRVCETILRALTGKIERELNLQLLKARLDKPTVKVDPQKVFLTGLLNDRIGALRQEFIGHRRHRKTALVKEQVQSQRMKQQQLILKQQQTVAVKQEELSVNEIEPSTSPAAKKPRKSKAKEPKIKRSGSPEQKNISSPTKRSRPLPTTEAESTPSSKKARRSRATGAEHRESSDNDENLLQNRKSSSLPAASTNAKMKSTEKPKKIITIKNSSNKKEKTEIELADINCSCQRKDVQEKFFIQCELCSRWMHGKCVDLTPRQAEKLNAFICQDCSLLTQTAKDRLYCICQTSYDESKFYIGCDVCADWLHGACVGLSPDEADKFEVYVCPRCSTGKKKEYLNRGVNAKTRKELLNLIEQLSVHKMAWPFQKPVDSQAAPNYYTMIKDPMDLATLKAKVMNSKFKTVCDFIRDVNKIFNNCRQYNPINSTFSLCANVVDTYFRQLLENLMNE